MISCTIPVLSSKAQYLIIKFMTTISIKELEGDAELILEISKKVINLHVRFVLCLQIISLTEVSGIIYNNHTILGPSIRGNLFGTREIGE